MKYSSDSAAGDLVARLLLAAACCSGVASAGQNSVETDVGADMVVTSDDSSLLDCAPFVYDKRGLLGLREVYSERDATYAGSAQGRARLTDQKNLKPYEANGTATGEWRRGRQAFKLGLGLNYSDSEAWGCSTTIASRLQRQRDLQNKVLVPGNSLHTKTGTAAYVYKVPGDTFTLAYAKELRIGDQTDDSSRLDASIDHAVDSNLLLQGVVGGGVHSGAFDPLTFRHVGAAVLYRPSRALSLSLSEDGEGRSTREQRLSTVATVTHATSRIVSEQLGLTVHHVVHSEISSDRLVTAGLRAALKRSTYEWTAHRLEIDDARQSAANWYTFVATYSLTRQQTLTGRISYGSEQPSLMRMMTSAGISYAALFGATNSRRGHDTPRYALTASYLVTRLVDLAEQINTVRQAQVGVLATF